ncbi:MAG: class I SAM-dependent methyltransferase, partial [Vicinamibacteraceae bacterium]
MTKPRDWDGTEYERLSAPMESWGREVLGRLVLRGDETVLDAGCGSGRVTELIRQRLPRGRIIGVDGSPSMIAVARQRLGNEADLRVMDLLELELDVPVEVVFSTATFHWIHDHGRLFGRLRRVLGDSGLLVAQCGGAGNLANVHAIGDELASRPPFDLYLSGWSPTCFAGPAETEQRLLRAGFSKARCWLEPREVAPPDL